MALPSAALIAPPPRGGLRLAVFNAGLARKGAGVLIHDLQSGDPQAEAVAEIVLRVRPDVLVLNELDADPEGRALALFQALLARGTAEVPGLDYPETFQG
ncbi:MAG: endonuclease/exonuclease/phosphatase family protein, partial [Pseudomonadota bacterium]